MIGQKNVAQLFVAKNITRTSTLTEGTILTSYNQMADGEIVAVDYKNAVLGDGTAVTDFRLIQRSGAKLLVSDFVKGAYITGYDVNGAAISLPQIDFVGYNGTSGSLDIDDDTSYTIKFNPLYLGESHDEFSRRQIKGGFYKSPATSATQYQVATGLFTSLVANFERDEESKDALRFGIVNNVTSLADFTGDGVYLKFTKGSKVVTVTDEDGTAVATNFAITAADKVYAPSQSGRKWTFTASADDMVVRIGETLYTIADAGTATDNAGAIVTAINAGTQAYASNAAAVVTIVYKEDTYGFAPLVYDVDADSGIATTIATGYGDEVGTIYECAATVAAGAASSFTLTKAFQGETGYAIGGTDTGYNTGIATVGTNYGIKIWSLPQLYAAGKDNYNVIDFTTIADDNFGSGTTVTTGTAGKKGIGVYKEAAAAESEVQLSEGGFLRSMAIDSTISNPRYDVVTNSAYNWLTINYKDVLDTALGQSAASWKQIHVVGEIHPTATTSNQMGSTDAGYEGLIDTLDDVIVSNAGVGSAQISNLNDGADL